jgi:hypothetical protein
VRDSQQEQGRSALAPVGHRAVDPQEVAAEAAVRDKHQRGRGKHCSQAVDIRWGSTRSFVVQT